MPSPPIIPTQLSPSDEVTPPSSSGSSPSPLPTHDLNNPRFAGINLTSPKDPQDRSYFGQLSGNQLFTAGFGLAILATALKTGQQGVRRGADLLRRRLLVDIEVTKNDEAYPWLLRWITAQHRQNAAGGMGAPTTIGTGTQTGSRVGVAASTTKIPSSPLPTSSSPDGNTTAPDTPPSSFLTTLLNKLTPGLHHLQIQTTRLDRPDGSSATHFSLVPGPGRHIIRYNGSFISINRLREKTLDLSTGTPFETVTLTTLYSNRHIFEHLFREAHQLAQQSHEGKTTMYTAFGADWRPFGDPKRKRPLNSVVLAEGVKDQILDDVRSFLDARTWYLDRGIPYRRGYLLYGPPGTGKSSFIQALAGELDFNIAILNVSERGLTDDRLNHLLTKVPARSIVLLEDADSAFTNRQKADEHGYSGATVTFSGLLNALDGVASAEERIIFLTTNHIDRLDEALIRPGRVDVPILLGHASEYQIGQLWDRFYDDLDLDGAGKRRFMARVNALGLGGRVSTAELQGLFLYHKGNIDGAVRDAGRLVKHSPQPPSPPPSPSPSSPDESVPAKSG